MRTFLLQHNQWFSTLLLVLLTQWNLIAQETSSASSDSKNLRTLRVLSYNIHHGRGVDGKLDLERIAKVIRDIRPDLVALQEVDVKTERTQKVDQIQHLARLTDMKYAFGGNLNFQGGKYGNGILSRYTINQSLVIKLPNHRAGEQRGAVLARIFLPGNQKMLFVSTHLDHRPNDSERIASVEMLNRLLASNDRQPVNPKKTDSGLMNKHRSWVVAQAAGFVVMAGDFNDVLESPTVGLLKKHWRPSNQIELPTIPVKQPRRQIDFVFSTGKQSIQCLKTTVLSEKVASDHRAILAVYQY